MEILYTAEARSTGGRDGRVRSSDGALDIELRPPKALGGPAGAATNPEQLFAAGYSACFLSALRLVAGREKIRTGDFTVEARVSLGQDASDGSFGLGVELRCKLPAVESEKAVALVQTAHMVCPYSRATSGNIDVALFVGAEPVAAPVAGR